MDKVLKFVTPDGGLRKNNKTILRPCKIKFWFERRVLSSAKRAENLHKKTGGHKLNY